jgi:hypothetical protein
MDRLSGEPLDRQALKASGHTNRLRIEAARAQGLAEAQEGADLAMFTAIALRFQTAGWRGPSLP